MRPDVHHAANSDAPAVDVPFDAFAPFYDDDYRHYSDDVDPILDLAEELGGPILNWAAARDGC